MNFLSFTVDKKTSIIEAMKVMDKAAKKIIFIQENGKLIGVATDGDFRRWILRGGNLNASVMDAASKNPFSVTQGNEDDAYQIMRERKIECVPVIDEHENVIKALFANQSDELVYGKVNIPVVIMAGGQGQRLHPYTKILPKPLIPIGDLTILERIANNFLKYDCSKFYFTLNYKKNIIKSYFNELSYDVEYIDEDEPLGTGGSLFYLKDKIKETFFVSNCDILISADYYEIFRYHNESKNIITVVASLKNTAIPYGVIELDKNGLIKHTIEKPSYNHLINTGMYVVEHEIINQIEEPKFINLTDIVENCVRNGQRVGVFPISQDAWLDMGRIKEMEGMIKELEGRK